MFMVDAAAQNAYAMFLLQNKNIIDKKRCLNFKIHFKTLKKIKLICFSTAKILEDLGVALIKANVLFRHESAKNMNYIGVKNNLKFVLINFIDNVNI
jgi:hypothetical protein